MNSQIKTVSILTAISLVAVGIIASSGMTTSLFVAPTNVVYEEGGIMGHISLEVYDSEGNIKMYRQLDNQIVNQGENCVLETLFGATSAGNQQCTTAGTFTKIAIGTDGTAVSAADTVLGGENTRAAGTLGTTTSSTGTGSTSAVQVISHTFTASAPVNLEESGLFDSTGAGNMFARQTFNTVPLNTDDTITVDWTITIGPN